jgi:hypothetical protein
VERIERGLVAHGWAGKPSTGRRRALQRDRGSKTLAAFRLALRPEGRAGKVVPGAARNASGNEHVARGCQLSLLSAINAGNTRTNRPHQAEISTAGRYTFAGRVRENLYIAHRELLIGMHGRRRSETVDSMNGLGGYHGSIHSGTQTVYFAVGAYSFQEIES